MFQQARQFVAGCLPRHATMKLLLMGYVYVHYIAQPCLALGESMMPTINPNPDGLPDIVWADMRKPHDVKPGDVVTLLSPNDPRKRFIKRVIAMPGEWVYCAGEMVMIPPGHCWVQGDNKRNSLDSRAFGPIPLALLQGRVTHVIFPFNRIQTVPNNTAWCSDAVSDPHELAALLHMDEESIRALATAYVNTLNK